MKKSILYLVLLLFLASLYSCSDDEKKLIEQGNELVEKVEAYRKEKGKLPESLEDLGIKDAWEGPLYYKKVDSVYYIIWFGTTVGESMTYYSDTKEWDYRDRGIGSWEKK